MYRNCIFCSADFGTNEAVEHFPVGRRLAFDGWRGRLWAVCAACGRWNLAPIEERWEAVEEAEKLFRDARLRVQSQNIGLARLPDGTRLVRVGQTLPGELAAWRYGTQLLRRRKRYFVLGGAGAVAGIAAFGGLQALGVSFMGMYWGGMAVQNRWRQKVVHRITAADDLHGTGLTIRRWHIEGLRFAGERRGGELALEILDGRRKRPSSWRDGVNPNTNDVTVVTGAAANAVLARAMVHVNRKGASRDSLKEADRILADAGSADRVLLEAARGHAALGEKAGRDPDVLRGPAALALEMALHEASERSALEGELAALEAAWKEAEEIAAIADSLPGVAALNRLLDRLVR
jgi:hypothetical protein